MEKILEDCRDRKVSLSYLAPFSYPFYRRYGYEQSFDKISYQLNSRDVPFIKKKSGKIKRMDFEDAKLQSEEFMNRCRKTNELV